MCAERLEQLRLKEEEAKERKAHDDLYAQLWEKDRQEKVSHLRELTHAFDKHHAQKDLTAEIWLFTIFITWHMNKIQGK